MAELGLTAQGGRKAEITGLAVDSREVKDGFLFAALPGTRVHGGEFISFALRMGAVAVLTDAGREAALEATGRLNATVFADPGISANQVDQLVRVLRALRRDAGDF